MDPVESMPPKIKQMNTKEGRRTERQKIGKLTEQQVSQSTKGRYQEALKDLESFTKIPLSELLHSSGVDEVLASYVEMLWEDGEPKVKANYTLAGIQFHRPSLKGQLRQSWRLLSLWNKLEEPRRATPLSPSLLLSFAGVLLQWQWSRLACLCTVGYAGLLRTGEMFLLQRQHVILPRMPDQSAVLFLVNTKTTQRNLLQSEKVLIKEKIAIESLRYLCAGLRKEDFLVTTSAAKFRSVWKDVVQHLGLQDFNYLPYSIRRGAATAAYNEGTTFDELLERGRWRHIATARLYLDQALQGYACINLPVQKLPLIRAAQRRFVAAELGKRGKEG